jgi:hypothetical protein
MGIYEGYYDPSCLGWRLVDFTRRRRHHVEAYMQDCMGFDSNNDWKYVPLYMQFSQLDLASNRDVESR